MGNIVEIRTAEPEEFEEAAMVMLKAYEEYSLILLVSLQANTIMI